MKIELTLNIKDKAQSIPFNLATAAKHPKLTRALIKAGATSNKAFPLHQLIKDKRYNLALFLFL